MVARVRVVASALCILLLASCKTAELSQGGSTVMTGQGEPPSTSCKPLGSVVGTGGGAVGGGYISNEALMEYAMNDLRNKAADMGANYVTHGQPQLGVAGDGESTATTTATVVGSAYDCPAGATAPDNSQSLEGRPARNGASDQKSTEPTGVAGFEFGVSPAEAELVCADGGFEWRAREREGYFGCSGTPRAVGLDATTLLKFCDDKLCWIRISGEPKTDKPGTWSKSFAGLKRALEQKYRRADESDLQLPSDCAGASMLRCLREGTARAKLTWKWRTRVVTLTMNKAAGEPAIRLVYDAQRSQVLDSDAL